MTWLALAAAAPAGGRAVAAARARVRLTDPLRLGLRPRSHGRSGHERCAHYGESDGERRDSVWRVSRREQDAQVQETSFLRKTSFCMLTCSGTLLGRNTTGERDLPSKHLPQCPPRDRRTRDAQHSSSHYSYISLLISTPLTRTIGGRQEGLESPAERGAARVRHTLSVERSFYF